MHAASLEPTEENTEEKRTAFNSIGIYVPLLIVLGITLPILVYLGVMQSSGWNLPALGANAVLSSVAGASHNVVLYESSSTKAYFAGTGGDYDSLLMPWKNYFSSRKLDYKEIQDVAQLHKLAEGVLILPSAVSLSDEERRAVVSRFELRTAHPGELLLTQGEAGRGLFLILRGRCSVSFRDVSGKDHALPGLGEGAVMGEISLLSGGAVTATVAAETACVLLFLDPATFVEHLLSNPAARALITRLGAERQGRTEAIDQQLVEPAFL